MEAFHRCLSFRDGRYNICGTCRNAKKRRDSPEARRRRELAALAAKGLRRCNSCGETKPLTEFPRNRALRGGGYSYECGSCSTARYMARPLAERNARIQVWATANPEAVRANGRKAAQARRARVRDAFVEHVDPRRVFEIHGGRCGICEEFVVGEFDVDHVIPLALGGDHSYVNTQPAHPGCNRAKGARLVEVA